MNVYCDHNVSGINSREVIAHFGIPDLSKHIDFWVYCNTVPPHADPARTILVLTEPPITDHRVFLYDNLHLFHTVIGYKHNGTNLFRFSDNPAIGPNNPCCDWDVNREDTRMKNHQIYYAGQISAGHSKAPHRPDFINLYPMREKIGKVILLSGAGVCFGRGWPNCTKNYPGHVLPGVNDSFRKQKIADMEKVDCDFVLCLENGIMVNYLCEKFHDGMMLDRVMLYLGEPNITDYVPANCFVDLRQFLYVDESHFGLVSGNPIHTDNEISFDTQGMIDYVRAMTQAEYDTIINNARKYRKAIATKWKDWQKKHQQFIIDRIEGQ